MDSASGCRRLRSSVPGVLISDTILLELRVSSTTLWLLHFVSLSFPRPFCCICTLPFVLYFVCFSVSFSAQRFSSVARSKNHCVASSSAIQNVLKWMQHLKYSKKWSECTAEAFRVTSHPTIQNGIYLPYPRTLCLGYGRWRPVGKLKHKSVNESYLTLRLPL